MTRMSIYGSSLGLLLLCCATSVEGAKRHPANVPPTREITVISPNADPLGRPTPVVKRGPKGELIVDIPPTVLVHNYYYTGDRSFQAQLLPGGPTIIVVDHPKTGERCYIDAHLMPGAPRVTYAADKIIYDYETHAMTIAFGKWFARKPVLTHRSGRTWPQKIAHVTHAEEIHEHAKQFAKQAYQTTAGAAVTAGQTVDSVVLTPAKQFVQVLPFGKALFGGDLSEQFTQTYTEHKRQHQIEKAMKQQRRLEGDYRTNR